MGGIFEDEQVVLLRFASRYAQGKNGKLFATVPNASLTRACVRAKIEHASPHAFRHAAGQWLLDLGVSIELVSRLMGHASTAITERVYARVKQEVVGDRILDMIDPRYARGAVRARKKADRVIETIRKIPKPHTRVLYTVDAVDKTLGAWAVASGIAKATLRWRVLERGMSMAQAIAWGPGPGRVSRQSPLTIRSTAGKLPGNSGTERPGLARPREAGSSETPGNTVGHDRLELSANGLRVRCSTN